MSVLIHGMELPKTCFDCPFMYGRIHCCANHKIVFSDPNYSELTGRYKGCPLVELPPHGRLIDADALCSAIENEIDECRWDNASFSGYRVWDLAEDAPTIIPAE